MLTTSEWRTYRLSEVAEIHDNLRLPVNATERAKRIESLTPDALYPYYGATGQVGWIDGYRMEGRFILVGEDGAPFLDPFARKAFAVEGRTWVNNHAHILRGKAGVLDDRFLMHALNATDYRAHVNGTTRLKLTQHALRNIPICMPSIEAQRRIAARIDELFSEIEDGDEDCRRAKQELETYRRSLLRAAVTGELTAEWRAAHPPKETGEQLLERTLHERRARWEKDPRNRGKRYKDPVALRGDALPQLPLGWTWASLDQLVSERDRSFQSGPFGSELRHSEFVATGKLVIGIDNVRDGYFSPGSDNRISTSKFAKLVRFSARPEDVLITVMATIGRTCVLPKELEEAIITKHVYRMTINQDAALPHFVETALRGHPSTLAHVFGSVQGQTRPGLNKSILEKAPIPLGPLDEQHEALAIAKQLLAAQAELLQLAEHTDVSLLRRSILAAAFRGKLVQ